jgi:hypothetical protein
MLSEKMPVFFFFFGCDIMKRRVGILESQERRDLRGEEIGKTSASSDLGSVLARMTFLVSVMRSFAWFESVTRVL